MDDQGATTVQNEDSVQEEGSPSPATESNGEAKTGQILVGTSVALTRDLILNQKYEPQIQRVDIPEWKGHVYVKELSGKQRDAFELSQLEGRGANQRVNLLNMRAKLVAFTCCDENGRLLFNEADARRLGDLQSRALTRIYRVATELSGLSGQDEEALTEELGEDQSTDSGSI